MVTGFSAADVADSFMLLEEKDFLISKGTIKEFLQIQNF